jgi:hypothetical protein
LPVCGAPITAAVPASAQASLGVAVRAYEVRTAWIGEKAGQLKFDVRLLARSPPGDLEEWRHVVGLADLERELGGVAGPIAARATGPPGVV